MELAFASDTQLKSSAFLGALFLENLTAIQQISSHSGNYDLPELCGYFYRCNERNELVFAQNTSNVESDLALPLDLLRIHLQIKNKKSLLNSSIADSESLLVDLSNQAFKQLYIFSNNVEFLSLVEKSASEQLEFNEMVGNMRSFVKSKTPAVH
ncbi:hypothetical protein [Alteromonas gilva]|uniref:Uncharacterized protein n=1 Tax=Alteromonas gilva TaxID=2987522 RepID=A0ABT5L8M6_9ALTE|nr:hypothetical protein [Alteromonas gilva]MDC8832869.1 hypothetical protein [Alteromonas gilva]